MRSESTRNKFLDRLPRVELKDIANLDDIELLKILAIRNEPSVRANMYTSHEISRDEHSAWAQRMKDSLDSRFFAVIKDGEIVGGVSLTKICSHNKRADWAFYLSETCQGQGVGAGLEYQFLTAVFRDFGIEKLNCEVLDFNDRVIRLHQKFGFKIEGVRRNHVKRDANTHNTVLLGITKEEWDEAHVTN